MDLFLNFESSPVTKTSFMIEMIDHNFSLLWRQCSLKGEGKVRIRFWPVFCSLDRSERNTHMNYRFWFPYIITHKPVVFTVRLQNDHCVTEVYHGRNICTHRQLWFVPDVSLFCFVALWSVQWIRHRIPERALRRTNSLVSGSVFAKFHSKRTDGACHSRGWGNGAARWMRLLRRHHHKWDKSDGNIRVPVVVLHRGCFLTDSRYWGLYGNLKIYHSFLSWETCCTF